jgi:competence protein ComEC
MPALLLAIACGILAAGTLARLPSLYALLWLIPLSFLLLLRYRWPKLLLAFCCGLSWGILYGYRALDGMLPEALSGQDFLLVGRVIDIPVNDARRQRFILDVEYATDKTGEAVSHFPDRVQISWYTDERVVKSGEQWQLLVRVKPLRSFVNPGGFDYEAWLLRRGIGATGYVRSGVENKFMAEPGRFNWHRWRYDLQQWLVRVSDSPRRGILLALLTGDRSLIDSDQWTVLQQTGTNHLVAISGLHVGFVALLGLFIGGALGRLINLFYYRFSVNFMACFCASSSALFYSVLAGLSLPTQRSLIMILVAQLAYLLHRSFRPRDTLLLAFVAVLLFDPLAAYDAGFWLSFAAVAVLLLAFNGRVRTRYGMPGASLFYSQWVVFIGLLLPLALMMNTLSLLAPIANIVAIPLVTFTVVPVLLLAAALRDVLPVFSGWLVYVADFGLAGMFWWLHKLLELADGHLNPAVVFNSREIWLAALGLGLILLPRGIPGKWLGYPALLIALVMPIAIRPPLKITVLDVGQGLAVVIQTPNHNLVYDAGPAYSENFDAGAGIVMPYLRRQGVRELDALVISHNDNDHAGGVGSLLKNFPVKRVLWGEAQRDGQVLNTPNANCHSHLPWEWDGVKFQIVSQPDPFQRKANNLSCVLLVEYEGRHILLPGDITQTVEQRLLRVNSLPENVTLLLAAHHGSRSSSGMDFVRHVRPDYVVYSAGYANRYGHPHPAVVGRFRDIDSQEFSTAVDGALEFMWRADGGIDIIRYREREQRYWYR